MYIFDVCRCFIQVYICSDFTRPSEEVQIQTHYSIKKRNKHLQYLQQFVLSGGICVEQLRSRAPNFGVKFELTKTQLHPKILYHNYFYLPLNPTLFFLSCIFSVIPLTNYRYLRIPREIRLQITYFFFINYLCSHIECSIDAYYLLTFRNQTLNPHRNKN